jgi:hypothetical protein
MKITICTLTVAVVSTIVSAQPVIDGVAYQDYGDVASIQNNATNFGDSLSGHVGYGDGSELDGGSAIIQNGNLYIHLGGNLQSNYNKLEIFIDARAGGQNRILATNPDVSYGSLQRMGDDGTGNGLTFDSGFEPDMFITVTCGDNGAGTGVITYVSYAELRTDGAGNGFYVGSGNSYYWQDKTGEWIPAVIASTGDIPVALDNSNWSGVVSGIGEDCGLVIGEAVQTGIELSIPLALFDWNNEGLSITSASICAFINAVDHNYVSNQVLGGLGGIDNLGDPRYVDFSAVAGNQFYTVGDIAILCGAAPSGACCFANGECWEDITETNCFDSRGAWSGEGSACADCDLCDGNDCPSDINADGIVDMEDLLELIGAWGTVCP